MTKRRAAKEPVKEELFVVASLERQIKHQEDRELVRLSQGGNEFAFEQLIRRHQQHVFDLVGTILRQTRRLNDVEDVAQQVFVKTYRNIRRFDQRAAFSTWLYRIAVNECRDYLRKKRARPLVYESDLSEEQVSRLEGIASAAGRRDGPSECIETKEALDHILGSLSEQDRQLLILRVIGGFSIRELAVILDLNVNTVKIRLFRVRGRVAEAGPFEARQPVRNKALSRRKPKRSLASSCFPEIDEYPRRLMRVRTSSPSLGRVAPRSRIERHRSLIAKHHQTRCGTDARGEWYF